MVQSLNPNRIVPVQEDLTTPYNQLEIIRGWEKMHRVDKERAVSSTEFLSGEWAVLGDNDKLTRPGGTGVANTFLVLSGTDRFDTFATGKCTVIMASKIIARTTKFNVGGTYHVGVDLTVKDTGGGTAVVTPAGGGDAILARVTKVVTAGQLEFEVL